MLVTVGVALSGLAVAAPAHAGGGPENVLLVVNPNSPDSLAIANHYVALRGIPAGNVLYVPWGPNAHHAKGADFRDKLLKPILQTIDERKLASQIDYVVYSSNFPWQLDFTDIHGTEKRGTPSYPIASLTGATYLFPFVINDKPELHALNTNFYFAPATGGKTTSRAFHSYLGWQPGAKAGKDGLHYLMSTMLGVTTGAGTTVDETVRYLKRSVEADGTQPDGAFFYMVNGKNPRSVVRHDNFAAAARELESLGRKAVVANGIVPAGQPDVLGLTCGAPVVPLGGSGCRLQPGALVDNLTSAGGQLQRRQPGKGQTPLTDYLRMGAAGASGTVSEPYAIPHKFPSADLHVHYARGCTMAEAFYQSIQGPFHLLIVGEPLCQPWAAPGDVKLTLPGLTGTLSGTVQLEPQVTYPDSRTVGRLEVFVDGVRVAAVRGQAPLPLDTTKLGDGHHRLTIVAVDDTPIEAQSRWSEDVVVKNGRDAVQLTTANGTEVTGGQLVVKVAVTRDAEVEVLHNGRKLGQTSGRGGEVRIPTAKLGAGPVQIEARTTDDPPLRARPLTVQIATGG